MALLTRLNICAAVISLVVMTGCAPRSASLGHPLTWTGLPATCVFQNDESLSTIAECFYGTNSLVATHVLWRANPDLRGRGWIKAGEKVTVPVLPDQNVPFSAGDTIHVFYTGCPPYGSDVVVAKDGFVLLPFRVKVKAVGQTSAQVSAAIERAYVPEIFVSLDVTAIRIEQGTVPNPSSAMPARNADDSETGHEP